MAGRRWHGAVSLYAGSLALTSAALLLVQLLGGGLTAELLALAVTWPTATVARLLLVRSWARRDTLELHASQAHLPEAA